jgi:hypothetical protein
VWAAVEMAFLLGARTGGTWDGGSGVALWQRSILLRRWSVLSQQRSVLLRRRSVLLW